MYETDNVTDFLAEYERRFEDAKAVASTDAERLEARELWRAWQRQRLNVLGETCRECKGVGDVVCGVIPADMFSPSENDTIVCPICKGKGIAIPEDHA